MKSDEFLNAINDIDSKYIVECNSDHLPKSSPKKIKKAVVVLMPVLLVIAVISVMLFAVNRAGVPQTNNVLTKEQFEISDSILKRIQENGFIISSPIESFSAVTGNVFYFETSQIDGISAILKCVYKTDAELSELIRENQLEADANDLSYREISGIKVYYALGRSGPNDLNHFIAHFMYNGNYYNLSFSSNADVSQVESFLNELLQ